MNIEIFTLCETASESKQGMNMLGIHSQVFATRMPAKLGQSVIVVRLNFVHGIDAEELQRIDIHLKYADGQMIQKLSDSFDVKYDGQSGLIMNSIIALNNFVMPKFGQYYFCLNVNNKPASQFSFAVLQRELPAKL